MSIKTSLWDDDNRSKMIIALCNVFLFNLEPVNFEFTTFFEIINKKFEELEKYFDPASFWALDKHYFRLEDINISACKIIIDEVEFYKSQLPLIVVKEAEDETKVLDRIELWNLETTMNFI